MAPGTRRANRGGYTDHDDFEGLPVRQWRQDWATIAPPPPQEQIQQNDIWAIELIHGMPKDSALLAPHSQELLRAARSGRLYKRPAPPEEEEADTDVSQVAEKTEKKEEESAAQGFAVKLWKQVPRNNEGPGLSYLAKRRKGTVTIASKTVEEKTTGPTVTRATVRRTDAAGNPYTEEVTLADGQQVVGEIISTRVEPAPTATGDGFVAPAPLQRRRPPPPKRRSKAGPGRGKKKLKSVLSGVGRAVGVSQPAKGAESVPAHGPAANQSMPPDGTETQNPESQVADGDDDDDDDDDDEDGDEGDEGEEGDEDDAEDLDQQGDDADDSKIQDEEMTDAVDEPQPPTPSKPAVDAMDGITTQADAQPPNPLTLTTPLTSLASHSPRNEGSPLKNAMIQSQSPTETQAPPTEAREPPIIPANAAEVAPIPAAAPAAAPAIAPAQLPAPETVVGDFVDGGTGTDSLVAEPPSSAAGDEGRTGADVDPTMAEAVEQEPVRPAEAPVGESQSEVLHKSTSPEKAHLSPDVPLVDEALLPPPPEQVGNIQRPRARDGLQRGSDDGDKTRDSQMHDSGMVLAQPQLNACDSVMTEDTIKPEDSASFRFPQTESGAPSEIGTVPAEETTNSVVAEVGSVAEAQPVAEAPREPSLPPHAATVTADTSMDAPAAAEPLIDQVMAVKSDGAEMSDEARPDTPGDLAPAPGDGPPAPEPTHPPAAFPPESNAEAKGSSPTEVVRGDEQSSAPEMAVQDSPGVDPLPPMRVDGVAAEELKADGAVAAEPVPEPQDAQEAAKTSPFEDSSRAGNEQRDEPAQEGVAEAQDERRAAPAEEPKPPALESSPPAVEAEPLAEAVASPPPPQQVPQVLGEKAPAPPSPTNDPAADPVVLPAPLPPVPPPPALPAILPPIGDVAPESHAGDEAEKEAPAGA